MARHYCKWTLLRLKTGQSYIGICDGRADLGCQPTSSSFGAFVAGFGEWTGGRCHSSGQLRYWHRGAVVSGLPRLNEEGAEIVVTLDCSLDHPSTVTLHVPQHSKSRLGTIQINEADCSPQMSLHLYVQVWEGACWQVVETSESDACELSKSKITDMLQPDL